VTRSQKPRDPDVSASLGLLFGTKNASKKKGVIAPKKFANGLAIR